MVNAKDWITMTRLSPMSEPNRQLIKLAYIKGKDTVILSLSEREKDWLKSAGYEVNGREVHL
jgi:hypothetical protein